MKPYRYLLRQEALSDFTRCTARQREDLIRHFHFLAEFPEHPPDREYSGEHGEPVCELRLGGWRLTYRVDGPVRQVQVLAIERLVR